MLEYEGVDVAYVTDIPAGAQTAGDRVQGPNSVGVVCCGKTGPRSVIPTLHRTSTGRVRTVWVEE